MPSKRKTDNLVERVQRQYTEYCADISIYALTHLRLSQTQHDIAYILFEVMGTHLRGVQKGLVVV